MDNKENLSVDFDESSAGDSATVEHHGNQSHHSHHSHHHSHHSHHHHHHSHSNRSKKEKAKRFIKRNKYKIANGFVALLFVCVLIIMGVSLDKVSGGSDKDASPYDDGAAVETQATLQLELPFFDEDVVVSGLAVEEYFNSDSSVSAESIYKKYASMGRLDTGLPVRLSYAVKSIPEGYSVRSAEVFVSEKSDFTNSSVYYLAGDETSVDVYHLKVNTQYYYRFTLSLSNGKTTSVDGSFRTAKTPRVLSVDGVCNMRDIGGWETVGGKTIRQGLLYRSAELDGAVEPKYSITPDGVNTMLTVFGIRTEMDLRHSSDNPNGTNTLGAAVNHNYYAAPMYGDVFTESGKAAIRNIFADLADKDNYPVLMHCTHGLDRTGTVCYLLEAILGMSEENLMKEYQLSALYHGSLWAENQMNEFIGQLKSYEGDTIQKKAENYLLSTGVTSAEIASIREIYLEG